MNDVSENESLSTYLGLLKWSHNFMFIFFTGSRKLQAHLRVCGLLWTDAPNVLRWWQLINDYDIIERREANTEIS